MDDCTLTDVLLDTMQTMSNKAGTLYEENRMVDAAAIINEWTTESDACVLTYFLQSNLQMIDDVMIYTTVENDELVECRFSFDPNALIETNDELD